MMVLELVSERAYVAQELEEAVREAVRQTDAEFMGKFNAGDAAGAVQAAYTRQAQIQPPGAPLIEGREEIATFWVTARQQLSIEHAELRTIQLRRVGDYIHQLGAVALKMAGGVEMTGKYAVLWKFEDDKWRWDVDTWNMDA